MAGSFFESEIGQTRPFRNHAQAGVVGILRAAELVRRHLDGVVQPHGLTFSQYNVLRVLRGAGGEGLPTLAVAERLIEASPGISRMIDRLVRKGWVRRARDAADGRRVLCRLTASGRRLLAKLDRAMDAADDAALAALGPRQQTRLVRFLEKICRDLAA